MADISDDAIRKAAWKIAHDHCYIKLTGRFGMSQENAEPMARQYADQFWRDWVAEVGEQHLAIAREGLAPA
jgi:hypothetical protein